MATLTWRNVDTPDFRGSLQGLQIASNALERGFGGLVGSLDKFQGDRMENNDRLALAAAQRIQDPDAYKAALANGSIMGGIDPTMMSTKAIGALDARTGDLLSRATVEQALGTSRVQDPLRTRGLQQLVTKGDQDIRFSNDTYDARVQNTNLAPVATQAGIDSTRAGTRSTNVNTDFNVAANPFRLTALGNTNRASDQAFNQSNTLFDRGTRDDSNNQNVNGWTARVLESSTNAADARAALNDPEFQKLPDVVRLGVMGNINQRFPGTISNTDLPTVPAGAPGQPASTGASRATASLGTAGSTSAGSSLPPVNGVPGSLPTETLRYAPAILAKAGELRGSRAEQVEQILPHLIQQESGGRENAVSSAGARGLTQVMPATGADPGYGVKPMQNQSREEQIRFGRDYLSAMLDKYDGNMTLALSAYNAGPQRVDNAISAGMGAQNTQVLPQLAARQSQDTSGINQIVPDYPALLQSRSTVNDEVTRLRTTGPYKDMEPDTLINMINDMVSRSGGKINPAIAGKLLEQSPEGSSMMGRAWSRLSGTASVTPNQSRVDELLARVNNGTTLTNSGLNESMTALQASLPNAKAAFEAAAQQAELAAQSPRMPEARRRQYAADANAKREAYERIMARILKPDGSMSDAYSFQRERQ